MEVNDSQIYNTSEVFNLTVLFENYRIKEHEQYIAYRPVACTFGFLIMFSNLTVVISSGLILKKGELTLNCLLSIKKYLYNVSKSEFSANKNNTFEM